MHIALLHCRLVKLLYCFALPALVLRAAGILGLQESSFSFMARVSARDVLLEALATTFMRPKALVPPPRRAVFLFLLLQHTLTYLFIARVSRHVLPFRRLSRILLGLALLWSRNIIPRCFFHIFEYHFFSFMGL